MKKAILKLLPLIDKLICVFVVPAAFLMKAIRRLGVQRFPLCRKILLKIGVFPIRNHYYEPQFDNNCPRKPYDEDRILPGIDWNVSGQLEMLDKFCYSEELTDLPQQKTDKIEFYFNNGAFESGDAEYLYQLIRTLKPKRLIEIGSGYSTLMAVKAINKNMKDSPDYNCDHICVEPYEMPWLEEITVKVVRKKVEEIDLSFFSQLLENDILFIDSSHIIRPEGDVLFEYLQLLPILNKGVIVHVHDIFTPRNYPSAWLVEEVRFWNEHYLLEAFLTNNKEWKILGALNYLHHNHYSRLNRIAPMLKSCREPGSFYLQKSL